MRATPPSAERKPVWEAGIGAVGVEVPNYPGADEGQFRGLALPYVIYRGEVFRFGDGSMARAVAIENERIALDVSIGGAFNAESEGNTAREGMEDLDFLFELGPQLVVNAYDGVYANGARGDLDVRLQTRAVFSTDFSHLAGRGAVFEPEVRYRERGLWGMANTNGSVSLALIFASEALQDYFYEVAPKFANAQRPAFNAKGGYLGAQMGVGASFKLNDDIRAFFGGNIAYYDGAANAKSPLLRNTVNTTIAAGFVYRMYKSVREVVVNDGSDY